MGEFTKRQLLYSIVGLFVGSLVLGLFLVLLVPPKTPENADLSEGRDKFCGECKSTAGGGAAVKVCTTCGSSPGTSIGYAMIGPSIALLIVVLLLVVYYIKKRRTENKLLPPVLRHQIANVELEKRFGLEDVRAARSGGAPSSVASSVDSSVVSTNPFDL